MPKSSSGIKRSGGGVKKQTQAQTLGKTYETVQSNINASSPTAIEQLRAMQSRGEIPQEIIGKPEERERLYEEFARIYDDPPGVLGEYKLVPITEGNTAHMYVEFTTDKVVLNGISVDDVNYIRKGRASELSKRGQEKHAVLKARGAAEIAASYRLNGWPNGDFSRKYGDRVLNAKQKAQVQQEIDDYLTSIFKSPITDASKIFGEDIVWRKVPGGWTRSQKRVMPD